MTQDIHLKKGYPIRGLPCRVTQSLATSADYTSNGKVQPCTGTEALYRSYGPQGEQRYSSILSLTTALERGEGPASCSGRFLLPGKSRYPLYRRLGGPQGTSGQVRKISPSPGVDPGPTSTQPVAIPTDLPGPQIIYLYYKNQTIPTNQPTITAASLRFKKRAGHP